MKFLTASLLLLLMGFSSRAQEFKRIYFNLYTDSLKKNTYNYINVEGITTDDRYLPLDTSHIIFTASAGTFFGNSLYIDSTCKTPSITVTATLRKKPFHSERLEIFIKQKEEDEMLPTEEEILRSNRPVRNRP